MTFMHTVLPAHRIYALFKNQLTMQQISAGDHYLLTCL